MIDHTAKWIGEAQRAEGDVLFQNIANNFIIMLEKGSPKSTTRRVEREALVLPHKNITIKTFFNEKVGNDHPVTYVHCSNSSFRNQYNIVQNRYKTTSFAPQTAHTNESFLEGVTPKGRAKKYFRQTSNSVRFVGKMRRKSLIATAALKSELKKEESQSRSLSGHLSRNKLLGQSGIETIRKQLQLKFNRTRIILKEQQKMQKYDKIQSIYENKYKMSRSRLNGKGESKQKLSRMDSRDSSNYCSPWNRVKIEGFDTIPELEPKFIHISQ